MSNCQFTCRRCQARNLCLIAEIAAAQIVLLPKRDLCVMVRVSADGQITSAKVIRAGKLRRINVRKLSAPIATELCIAVEEYSKNQRRDYDKTEPYQGKAAHTAAWVDREADNGYPGVQKKAYT